MVRPFRAIQINSISALIVGFVVSWLNLWGWLGLGRLDVGESKRGNESEETTEVLIRRPGPKLAQQEGRKEEQAHLTKK